MKKNKLEFFNPVISVLFLIFQLIIVIIINFVSNMFANIIIIIIIIMIINLSIDFANFWFFFEECRVSSMQWIEL